MEFEEVLPYQDFAIRLQSSVIHGLPELLEEVLQEPGRVNVSATPKACPQVGQKSSKWIKSASSDNHLFGPHQAPLSPDVPCINELNYFRQEKEYGHFFSGGSNAATAELCLAICVLESGVWQSRREPDLQPQAPCLWPRKHLACNGLEDMHPHMWRCRKFAW